MAGGGLAFVEGNAEALTPFPDESFDAYTVAFGIRNVTDRAAALREACRVLKPGGRCTHALAPPCLQLRTGRRTQRAGPPAQRSASF